MSTLIRLPARLCSTSAQRQHSALVDVADGGQPVLVRWRAPSSPGGAPVWICAECGRQREPGCAHSFAAALLLAEALLGLTVAGVTGEDA